MGIPHSKGRKRRGDYRGEVPKNSDGKQVSAEFEVSIVIDNSLKTLCADDPLCGI